MKKKPGITEAILAGIGDAEKDDDRDNVRGEDPSKDDDAPEHRDTLDMAGPPDIDKVVTDEDPSFAPDANMTIKDDAPEITSEERSLVSEFWNAKEAYDYSERRGHPVDVVKASKRMEAAAGELIDMGFFSDRVAMPTLDELGPETGEVEEAVPSSVPSAADPIPQYGDDQPEVGDDPHDDHEPHDDDQPEVGEGDVALVLDRGRAVKMGLTADDVNPEELKAGVEVEMEHTDDPRVAEVIALDHLAEDRGYYTGDDGLIAWERRKTGDPHDPHNDGKPGPQHSLDMHDDGDDGY